MKAMVILAIQLVKQSSAVFVLAELAFRGQIPGKSKHKAYPSLYLIPEIMLFPSIETLLFYSNIHITVFLVHFQVCQDRQIGKLEPFQFTESRFCPRLQVKRKTKGGG